MKKIIALLLAAMMVFSLAACGSDENTTTEPSTDPSIETPSTEPSVETTDEPSEEPTEEPSEDVTEEPTDEPTETPTEEPTEEPSVETTTEPTEEPSEETPTEEPAAPSTDVDVMAIMDKIFANLEMPATMPLGDMELNDLYGIDVSSVGVESYYVAMPMMMTSASEIAIFEVSDAAAMDAVKAGIQTRLAQLETTWSMYLPDQYELVKNHIIRENGNYIIFAVCSNTDYVINVFDRAFDPSIEEMVLPATFYMGIGVVTEMTSDGFIYETSHASGKTFTVKVTVDEAITYVEGDMPTVGDEVDVAYEMSVVEDLTGATTVYEAMATYVAKIG